jgi:threonine dehydrogenase-like Zn-dependent dehydrogenase
VPGGQAEYLRVPQAHFGPIKVPNEGPDERWLFLSDVLTTAWNGVRWADIEEGSTCAVVGLGPIGQMAARIAKYLGASRVIGIDIVPERLGMARRHGIDVIDGNEVDDVASAVFDMTNGRGADGVVEAVGMEAHGSPLQETAQRAAGLLPDALARKAIETAGVDRLSVLHSAIDSVRRGGTVSLSGVYGGNANPMPLFTMFDKQLQLRMGQCNVRRWTEDLLPLVEDPADPLGVTDLMTHEVSIDEAPEAYSSFQKKQDGCIKVVLKP